MASKKTGNGTLNAQQIKFCENYVSPEMFMNGSKSYSDAYPDITQDGARRAASKLLTNIDILNYIDSLIDDSELNDARADKELKKLVLQDDEKNVKLGAIKHYDALKSRIEKGKQKALDDGDISVSVLGHLSIKDLEEILNEGED